MRAARAGLADVDRDLVDAARVDGATDWHVLRWISLPLASSALCAGIVLCWARALGEFGATIMFAGSIAAITRTLPLFVYGEFQAGDLKPRSRPRRSSSWPPSWCCCPFESCACHAQSTYVWADLPGLAL